MLNQKLAEAEVEVQELRRFKAYIQEAFRMLEQGHFRPSKPDVVPNEPIAIRVALSKVEHLRFDKLAKKNHTSADDRHDLLEICSIVPVDGKTYRRSLHRITGEYIDFNFTRFPEDHIKRVPFN